MSKEEAAAINFAAAYGGEKMKIKKKIKRIIAVAVIITVVLVISYLIYTGGQAGA